MNRNLGGPYVRGIGRGGGGGGGGSGLVSEDHSLAADKTYEGRSDKIDGVSTTGNVSTDHTMDIDIESSSQHAVGSSSAAIMSFMAWVVAAEQSMAKISQASVSAEQWFDAEENDTKPSAIDNNENTTNETVSLEKIISPLISNPSAGINKITSPSFTINSVGINNFLGTPGVPIQASVGDSTVVISPINNDITVSQTFDAAIVKNASITATRHGGRRHFIPGPPTISKYNITLRPSTVTREFQIENIIGDLLKAMQVVDPSATILTQTDKAAHKLSDISHIP